MALAERRNGAGCGLQLPRHEVIGRQTKVGVVSRADKLSRLTQRRRSEQSLIEGEAVEKRLEGGACLPVRLDGVHVARGGQRPAAADVRQHVARGIVHDQDGAVVDALVAHGQELTRERVGDEALKRPVERGCDACRRAFARC